MKPEITAAGFELESSVLEADTMTISPFRHAGAVRVNFSLLFCLDLRYISYIHIFDVKNNSMLLTAMSNQFFFSQKS
jgi:hypothetical protein